MGLEPTTSSVTGWRSKPTELPGQLDGDNRTRTCDSLLVRQVLYQLSYTPVSTKAIYRQTVVLVRQATRDIIHQTWQFVNPYFKVFLFFFFRHEAEKQNFKTGQWAIRDSNPGPTGYEPVALTN